jgi:hypothetical protein
VAAGARSERIASHLDRDEMARLKGSNERWGRNAATGETQLEQFEKLRAGAAASDDLEAEEDVPSPVIDPDPRAAPPPPAMRAAHFPPSLSPLQRS